MGWPEAMVACFGVIQVIALAWIATKQAQVKRDLNGHQQYVVDELKTLEEALGIDPSAIRRHRARRPPVP